MARLMPGDCLYIPASWLHEVHATAPSFSLGWRVAMRERVDASPTGGGAVATSGTATRAIERNAGQKLERMAASVKSGEQSLMGSLEEAMKDPEMMEMLMKQAPGIMQQQARAKIGR